MTRRFIPRWYQCGMLLFGLFWHAAGMAQGPPLPAMRVASYAQKTTNLAARSTVAPLKILALRVAFEPDSNLSTTGAGLFLTTFLDSLYYTYPPGFDPLDLQEVLCDAFLVDPPPHNVAYFQSQLLALNNYFNVVTGGNITFDLAASDVFPAATDPLTIGPMADYTTDSDVADSSALLLVMLLDEALAAAENAGAEPLNYDLVIVFHAGLGQDFNYQVLDPTPRDIPSTYVDSDMIWRATGSTTLTLPSGAAFGAPALIVPEGQNHIFYDIAADIFFGSSDLCNVQIGLTGTLALLVGYALGLPPLFDTELGNTGVGQFGLMDVGSGNGQGVVPAPPSAWMRTFMGWETAEELLGPVALTARHLPGSQIGQVTLSHAEYLLIENRLNWVIPGVDMDSLRFRNAVIGNDGSFELPNYFDYLIDSAGAVVDSSTQVIISVPNYDIGLPGSGLLIWQVNDHQYNSSMAGINNDRSNRAVSVLEADGATDIGFPTTALFADPTVGWRWDMWYAGNPAWIDANPRLQLEAGAPLRLTPNTNPPLRVASGGSVGIAITGIGRADSLVAFLVEDTAAVTRLPEGARLLGFNGVDWFYRLGDSVWMGVKNLGFELIGGALLISEHDAPSQPRSGTWIIDNAPDTYTAYRIDPAGEVEYSIGGDGVLSAFDPREYPYYNDGYLHLSFGDPRATPDSTRIRHYQSVREAGALYPYLADMDGDGHEDWLSYSGTSPDRELSASSSVWHWDPLAAVWIAEEDADSLTLLPLDGFPLNGDFRSHMLIANLVGDIFPEIVAVEGDDLVIINHEGVVLERMGLHDPFGFGPRFLMHMSDGRVGLSNTDRIHWFTPEVQNPQWVTRHGRHSRGYLTLNDRFPDQPQPPVLDKSRVYNYPNPVTGGRTTIRFYVGQGRSASIRIYTVDGRTVAKGEIPSLWQNNYNEWVWTVGSNAGGLYYGLVKIDGSDSESALIKIAVVR